MDGLAGSAASTLETVSHSRARGTSQSDLAGETAGRTRPAEPEETVREPVHQAREP